VGQAYTYQATMHARDEVSAQKLMDQQVIKMQTTSLTGVNEIDAARCATNNGPSPLFSTIIKTFFLQYHLLPMYISGRSWIGPPSENHEEPLVTCETQGSSNGPHRCGQDEFCDKKWIPISSTEKFHRCHRDATELNSGLAWVFDETIVMIVTIASSSI
jgi:hypothetical protein